MENKKNIDKIEILSNIKDTLFEWTDSKETGILSFEIITYKGGVRGFNIIRKQNIK